MEITEKEQVSRTEAAARLRTLATALAKGKEVEYERGDLSFSIDVPDKVDFKLEIEVQDDEWELEVELKWGKTKPAPAKKRTRAKKRTPAKKSAPAKKQK